MNNLGLVITTKVFDALKYVGVYLRHLRIVEDLGGGSYVLTIRVDYDPVFYEKGLHKTEGVHCIVTPSEREPNAYNVERVISEEKL